MMLRFPFLHTLGLLGLVSNAFAAELPHFTRLQCQLRSELVVATKDNVTLTLRQRSAPEEIYNLFEVPEINRKGYKQVEVSISIPTSQCEMPSGFSIDMECDSGKAINVTLKASTKSSSSTEREFDYEHTLKTPVKIRTALNEKKTGQKEMRSVLFEVKFGDTAWTTERDIFRIDLGKSNLCYVNKFFEIN